LDETKNGWKTFTFDCEFVNPKPVDGLTENPVIIQDVIVSGTFLVIVMLEVLNEIVSFKS